MVTRSPFPNFWVDPPGVPEITFTKNTSKIFAPAAPKQPPVFPIFGLLCSPFPKFSAAARQKSLISKFPDRPPRGSTNLVTKEIWKSPPYRMTIGGIVGRLLRVAREIPEQDIFWEQKTVYYIVFCWSCPITYLPSSLPIAYSKKNPHLFDHFWTFQPISVFSFLFFNIFHFFVNWKINKKLKSFTNL